MDMGEDRFSFWTRAVKDEYKDKSNEEIKLILKTKSNPFAVLAENLVGDFNISCLIRSANNFNAREFFYLGDKRFDRRGAISSYKYTDVTWLSTIDDLIKLKEKYTFIAIDNFEGAKSLHSYDWKKLDKEPLIILGSESVGISPLIRSLCEDMLFIFGEGAVRSINVAAAGSIVMYDILSKLKV